MTLTSSILVKERKPKRRAPGRPVWRASTAKAEHGIPYSCVIRRANVALVATLLAFSFNAFGLKTVSGFHYELN